MGIKTVQDTSLTSVANAIRVKAEISGTLEFPDEFVSAIQNISTGITPSGTKTITENGTYDVTNFASADVNVSGGGGSVSVPPKEVNFYDYDGTVVDAYTATEFANLSAMPANPTHDGLTAQGWNWSLADAKAYVAKYGRLNIGQMYVTTSGDTEIDIQLGIGRNKPYLGCCPNGTVEIDWGDGSAHDTLTGTSVSVLQSIQHTYPDTGEPFTIKLHLQSGSLGIIGDGANAGSQLLFNGAGGDTNGQRAYQAAVKAIRLGNGINLREYAFNNLLSVTSITLPDSLSLSSATYCFQYCLSLKSLTIPTAYGQGIPYNAFRNCYSLKSILISSSTSTIADNAFQYCRSLPSADFPSNVEKINSYAFQYCDALSSMIMPSSVTRICSYCFSNCYSLSSVIVPSSVTRIDTYAFDLCKSLSVLIFEPTTPPKAGANAFANLPSDLVVYVPNGTLSAYQSASNYSSISSKMVEMSA